MTIKILFTLLIALAVTLQFGVAAARPKSEEQTLQYLLTELSKHPDNAKLRAQFKKLLTQHIVGQILSGQKRIRTNPKDVSAYLNVAKAYYMANRTIEAEQILQDGILQSPDSVALWMTVGWFELQAKRPLEALSVFREVVRLDSRNAPAHHHIAYLLARPNDGQVFDLSQALLHAKLAVDMQPNNTEFIRTLAEIHEKMGDTRVALALLKRAISIAPDDELLRDRLARLNTK